MTAIYRGIAKWIKALGFGPGIAGSIPASSANQVEAVEQLHRIKL